MRSRPLVADTAIAVLLLLCGCGVAPPSASPQSLALIDAPEPSALTIFVENHPNAGGSQIQGLFFASEMQSKSRDITAAVKRQSFAPGTALTEALADALRANGRTVARAPNPIREREEFLKQYATIGATAGIVLDVYSRAIGYWSESPTGPLRPWLIVAYRLYDNKAHEVLTEGQIGIGPPLPGETAGAVADDTQTTFASFDALVADPAQAERGIRAAMRSVARTLAGKL